jgi:hypothetical protein
MSGFILKEIETDKILMVRGEERLIVAFNDHQRPKTREVVAMTTAAPSQISPDLRGQSIRPPFRKAPNHQ